MVDPDIVAAFNCSLEFSPPGLNMPLFTVCWRNALYIVNNNEKLKVWMWSIHSCVTIYTMVEAELSNCWMHLLGQSSEEVYNSGFIIFHMGSSLWCLNMSSPFSMRVSQWSVLMLQMGVWFLPGKIVCTLFRCMQFHASIKPGFTSAF